MIQVKTYTADNGSALRAVGAHAHYNKVRARRLRNTPLDRAYVRFFNLTDDSWLSFVEGPFFARGLKSPFVLTAVCCCRTLCCGNGNFGISWHWWSVMKENVQSVKSRFILWNHFHYDIFWLLVNALITN